MEFLFEIIVQVLGELLLQIVFEALAEMGLRSMAASLKRRPNPWLAGVGYAMLGALLGAVSVLIFPSLFITSPAAQIAHLLLAPVIAGLAMAALGAWRHRRGQLTIRLDRFGYGYVFALAMSWTRYVMAD